MSAALTRLADPEVEREVDGQLRRAVDALRPLAAGDRPYALLLAGSFGRGEGVARIRQGRLEVQNDYDLELVLDGSPLHFLRRYRWLRPRVDAAMDAVAREIGVKQIDVGIKSLALLARGPRTIARYELVRGHRLLAGDEALLRKLPAVSGDEIPLEEGARLLLNRGGGLLMAATYCRRRGRLSAAEWENLELEMAKAVLACGDLRLLARGLYRPSQVERAAELRERRLLAEPPPLEPRYARVLRYKLDWEPWLDRARPWEEWERLRDAYLSCWRRFESLRLGREIDGWEDYLRIRKPRHEPLLRDLGRLAAGGAFRCGEHRLLLQRVRRGREVFLLSVLPLLLETVRPRSAGAERLSLASKVLAVDAPAASSWERAAEVFLRLWHPEGEAGRVAAGLAGATHAPAVA